MLAYTTIVAHTGALWQRLGGTVQGSNAHGVRFGKIPTKPAADSSECSIVWQSFLDPMVLHRCAGRAWRRGGSKEWPGTQGSNTTVQYNGALA